MQRVTTRTKLILCSYTACVMMLALVFSKPLHIPEAFQWVLIVGGFIPLGLLFFFNKKLKAEQANPPVQAAVATDSKTDLRAQKRKMIIIMMVLGSLVGLGAPFWLPLTGTSLGWKGNLEVGMITMVVVCVIFGLRLRKT